jgi:hypothetical protein
MHAMETLLHLEIKCILMSRITAHLNTLSLGTLDSPHDNYLSYDFSEILGSYAKHHIKVVNTGG